MWPFSWFRRVDPYSASFEKPMQRVKEDMERLKARGAQRQQLWARVQARFWAGFAAAYVVVLGYAAWVLRQLPGRFTAAQHSARVAPVLLMPLVAFLLHAALRWLAGALGRRDARRLRQLEARLRKMVGELKDSTHYERTLELLRKYDPDYVPPARPEPLPLLAAKGMPPGAPGNVTKATAAMGRLATGTLQGAGSTLLPVLGQLWAHAADTFIADDPVMVRLMREAQLETEAARARLAAAEGRAAQLAAENAQLREQLGLPPAAEEEGQLAAAAVHEGQGRAAAEAEAGNRGQAAEGEGQGSPGGPVPVAAPQPADAGRGSAGEGPGAPASGPGGSSGGEDSSDAWEAVEAVGSSGGSEGGASPRVQQAGKAGGSQAQQQQQQQQQQEAAVAGDQPLRRRKR